MFQVTIITNGWNETNNIIYNYLLVIKKKAALFREWRGGGEIVEVMENLFLLKLTWWTLKCTGMLIPTHIQYEMQREVTGQTDPACPWLGPSRSVTDCQCDTCRHLVLTGSSVPCYNCSLLTNWHWSLLKYSCVCKPFNFSAILKIKIQLFIYIL